MKNLSLLVWISQLGLSVAAPLAGFTIVGVFLRDRFELGAWIIILGVLIGVCCAIMGLRNSLKTMGKIASDETKEKPPVSFNDHE